MQPRPYPRAFVPIGLKVQAESARSTRLFLRMTSFTEAGKGTETGTGEPLEELHRRVR